MKALQHHPAADAFPMMDNGRYAELRDDIERNGQLEPVTICAGMVLDGRNRYRACVELGIEPKTREFSGDDPWLFAWSMNGERRDIVADQRYLIWKFCHEQSEVFQATKKRIADEANKKRSEATKKRERKDDGTLADGPVVGHSVLELDADTIDAQFAIESERAAVRSIIEPGKVAKSTASNTNLGAVARGDKLAKKRPDLEEAVRKGEIKPAEAHRQLKKDEVAQKTHALPPDKFAVLYADPPWKYNDGRTGDLMTATGAQHHYPVMTLSELKALDIPSISAENSVLFLWATCPLLEDALALCKAWGFQYKAQFVWDKVKHNMGHYNSVRHELLLICTKGSCTPQNVKLVDSVQSIERTEHSKKPEEFRTIIETLYPNGNRIELFARAKAKGWKVWGNES